MEKATLCDLQMAIKRLLAKWWCLMPLIPALRRQRQVDLCEFEASLVYRASSRTDPTGSKSYGGTLSQKTKTKQKKFIFFLFFLSFFIYF